MTSSIAYNTQSLLSLDQLTAADFDFMLREITWDDINNITIDNIIEYAAEAFFVISLWFAIYFLCTPLLIKLDKIRLKRYLKEYVYDIDDSFEQDEIAAVVLTIGQLKVAARSSTKQLVCPMEILGITNEKFGKSVRATDYTHILCCGCCKTRPTITITVEDINAGESKSDIVFQVPPTPILVLSCTKNNERKGINAFSNSLLLVDRRRHPQDGRMLRVGPHGWGDV